MLGFLLAARTQQGQELLWEPSFEQPVPDTPYKLHVRYREPHPKNVGTAQVSVRIPQHSGQQKSSIAAIEDSLKAEMLAKNTDVLSGKDYLITWKTIITNRFDSAAFKLTHADLFNQFSRSTTTRRFVIA